MESYVSKDESKADQSPAAKLLDIRITLSGTTVAVLETFSEKIVNNANAKSIQFKGPVRLPTKKLVIPTRKTPNGEGSKTWDHYEMRIHKRIITLKATADAVKVIAAIPLPSGVIVEVTVLEK